MYYYAWRLTYAQVSEALPPQAQKDVQGDHETKELHFFDGWQFNVNGLIEYERRIGAMSDPGIYCIDATPAYIITPNTPKRLRTVYPNNEASGLFTPHIYVSAIS